jgi:hypothetical protein
MCGRIRTIRKAEEVVKTAIPFGSYLFVAVFGLI